MQNDRFVSGDDPLAVIVTRGQDLWTKADVEFIREERIRLQTHQKCQNKTNAKAKVLRASLAGSSHSY